MLLHGLHSQPCFQQRTHTIRGACHSPAFPDAGHVLVMIFRVQGLEHSAALPDAGHALVVISVQALWMASSCPGLLGSPGRCTWLCPLLPACPVQDSGFCIQDDGSVRQGPVRCLAGYHVSVWASAVQQNPWHASVRTLDRRLC